MWKKTSRNLENSFSQISIDERCFGSKWRVNFEECPERNYGVKSIVKYLDSDGRIVRRIPWGIFEKISDNIDVDLI